MTCTPPKKQLPLDSIVQTIPMNHLGRKSCSAEASTIFVFHLHCTTIESSGNCFFSGTHCFSLFPVIQLAVEGLDEV